MGREKLAQSTNNNSPRILDHIKVEKAKIISYETVTQQRNTFTLYAIEVHTKTFLPSSSLSISIVHRRYSEFYELLTKLNTLYPQITLPHPPKRMIGSLNEDTIYFRWKSLQAFIDGIAENKLLDEPVVKSFLYNNHQVRLVALNLFSLPHKLLDFCLSFLSFSDLLSLSMVCIHFCRYISPHPSWGKFVTRMFDLSEFSFKENEQKMLRSSFQSRSSSHQSLFISHPTQITIDRVTFLKYHKEYFKMRKSIVARNSRCDCISRKLVGTVLGDKNCGKTCLLASLNTIYPAGDGETLNSEYTDMFSSSQRSHSASLPNILNSHSPIKIGKYRAVSCESDKQQKNRGCHVIHIITSPINTVETINMSACLSRESSRQEIHNISSPDNKNNNSVNSENNISSSPRSLHSSAVENSPLASRRFSAIFSKSTPILINSSDAKNEKSVNNSGSSYTKRLSDFFTSSTDVITNAGENGSPSTTFSGLNLSIKLSGLFSSNNSTNSANSHESNINLSTSVSAENNINGENSLNTSSFEVLPVSRTPSYPLLQDYVLPLGFTNPHKVSDGVRLFCYQLYDSTSNDDDFIRYHNLSRSNFVIIAFSLVDRTSYENVKNKWLLEVIEFCGDVPILLVGTHADLRDQLEREQQENPTNETSGESKAKFIKNTEGLILSEEISAIHYIETPTPQSNLPVWENNFLRIVGNRLYSNIASKTKSRVWKTDYTEKLCYLGKIFPSISEESVGTALSASLGDVIEASRLLSYQTEDTPFEDKDLLVRKLSNGSVIPTSANGKITPSQEHSDAKNDSNQDWKQEMRSDSNKELNEMDYTSKSKLMNEAVLTKSVSLASIMSPLSVTSEITPPVSSLEFTLSSEIPASHNTPPIKRRNQERQIHIEKMKKTVIEKFFKDFTSKRKGLSLEHQGELVSQFLLEQHQSLEKHELWLGETNDVIFKVIEEFEKLIMGRIYKLIFAVSSDDLEKDNFLRERIARLSTFLTPQHLEINEKAHNDVLWQDACRELSRISSVNTASEKLTIILDCCKIITVLLSCCDCTSGADDLLPHLIYVLIKANPPHLASNMHFISRFCNPEVMRIEKYYYYTSLTIAVSFLETVDASALNMDPKEFEKHMHNEPSKSTNKMRKDPELSKDKLIASIDSLKVEKVKIDFSLIDQF